MAHEYSPVQMFDIKIDFLLSLFVYICSCSFALEPNDGML